MKKIVVLVLIAAFIIVPYFALDRENRELDGKSRSFLPGSFIGLSDGVTRYELGGPKGGTPIVLVHGFSIPSFTWDYVFEELTKAGFRVLSYDLYGRGFSDRPRTEYNPALFERQLAELLGALRLKGPVDLVGISIGGAVVIDFTAKHPEMVRKIALISPYGFPQDLGFGAKLVKTPLVGDWLMAIIGDRVFMGKLAGNFNKPLDFSGIKKKFSQQMAYKGYKRALLSTMRHFMPLDFSAAFEAVGKQKRPVLLIWGKKDAVVPFSNSERVRQTIPQVEFYPFDDRGHTLTLEDPEAVSRILMDFFKK